MTPTPDRRTVRQLAELARIDLDAADAPTIDELVQHLRDMLAWVEQLASVDVEGVEPMIQPIDLVAVLRDDVPGRPPGVETILRDAPEHDGDCFVVPRIIGDSDDD